MTAVRLRTGGNAACERIEAPFSGPRCLCGRASGCAAGPRGWTDAYRARSESVSGFPISTKRVPRRPVRFARLLARECCVRWSFAMMARTVQNERAFERRAGEARATRDGRRRGWERWRSWAQEHPAWSLPLRRRAQARTCCFSKRTTAWERPSLPRGTDAAISRMRTLRKAIIATPAS